MDDWPAVLSYNCSSSDDNTEDEECTICILDRLNVNPNCRQILHHETKMLSHHRWTMGIKDISVIEHAVNRDPE